MGEAYRIFSIETGIIPPKWIAGVLMPTKLIAAVILGFW